MIHLKKEKRRTKALVRDYIGKTVFLRREVSIPLLRMGVQRDYTRNPGILPCFNSHTARGSSTECKLMTRMLIAVSIPILRVGVQLDPWNTYEERIGFNSHTARGSSTHEGVHTETNQRFNSHTARGSSTAHTRTTNQSSALFQFPYCAWEFNIEYLQGQKNMLEVSIPILRVGVQHPQPPCWRQAPCFNSHTARGSSTHGFFDFSMSSTVSIPILRVGVQPGMRWRG